MNAAQMLPDAICMPVYCSQHAFVVIRKNKSIMTMIIKLIWTIVVILESIPSAML